MCPAETSCRGTEELAELWERAQRCTYLGGPSEGRGWFGGHSGFSHSQGVDCHSTRHTDYKSKITVGNKAPALSHSTDPPSTAGSQDRRHCPPVQVRDGCPHTQTGQSQRRSALLSGRSEPRHQSASSLWRVPVCTRLGAIPVASGPKGRESALPSRAAQRGPGSSQGHAACPTDPCSGASSQRPLRLEGPVEGGWGPV